MDDKTIEAVFLRSVNQLISEKEAAVKQFLADLAKRNNVLTEFEPEAWHSPVYFVTVYSLKDIRITFKNGKEI